MIEDNRRKVKVYDVFEKDVSKKLIQTFDSVSDAAKYCGVQHWVVRSAIRDKTRCHINSLNKTIAFR